QSDSIAGISNDSLDALVKERTLEERDAKELGLTATLYHFADENFDLAGVLKDGEFHSVPGGRLSQVRDLVALSADDWRRAVVDAQVQPPDGLDRNAYAAQLQKKVADLFPTDTLLARTVVKH